MTTPTKISPNFYFHEFFPQGIWQRYDDQFLRKLVDERLINIMEEIRSDLGKPIYINNWKWGGNSMYRGFRPMSYSESALYSQHKFGRGTDFNVKDNSPDEVRNYIINNEAKYLEMGLTRLEDSRDATTWVHLDLAWTGLDVIKVFRA